ncbi:MAG: FAD-linked oxidoreductase-like protein [Piptocephalis tieghemiana]|nr:MAG: FAD-linked oxidoreductase-like protein [Piptocephalis tieghemiana]
MADTDHIAFGSTPTATLLHQWLILQACRIPYLPSVLGPLLRISHALHLDPITHWILSQTAFSHFCGGRTPQDTLPLMNSLAHHGVFTILDLGIETDPAEETSEGMGEDRADMVAAGIAQAISTAKTMPDTMVALKISALTALPDHLVQWSDGLREARRRFHSLATHPPAPKDQESSPLVLVPKGFEEGVDKAEAPVFLPHSDLLDFQGFRSLVSDLAPKDADLTATFKQLDRRGTGQLDWVDLSRLWDVERLQQGWSLPGCDSTITSSILNSHSRISKLCDVAASSSSSPSDPAVPLLMDAEYSSVQPAIRHLTLLLSQTYNALGPQPLVYDTLQMYLREGPLVLTESAEDAKRDHRPYAVKLVRGAYVARERRDALAEGRPDRVWPSKALTDAAYDGAASWLASRSANAPGSTHTVLATHNGRSIAQSLEASSSSSPSGAPSPYIAYAQLMGMGELVTARLRQRGARVGKYVVYGEVSDLVPYMVRRVEENAEGVQGGGDADVLAIQRILLGRLRALLNPFSARQPPPSSAY